MNVRLVAASALLITLLSVSHPSVAKTSVRSSPQAAGAAKVSANPADVSSIDAIIGALYDVISGPAGKKRDWDRMRSLFIDGARLIPSGKRQSGEIGHRVLDVEGYITGSAPFLEKEGFFEREFSRRTEQWGHIAHVFSTYESKHNLTDEKPLARGINSIQLLNDGKRWWIVTVFWEGESPDNPLPEKYLKPGAAH